MSRPRRYDGARVVADLGLVSGGYAELALAPAEVLHLLPDSVAAEQAVAMIGTGRTTMAILELAAPTAGDVALVTAAAGGIGTLLVQALRNAGATVIGAAAGQRKVDVVRALGAAGAVDYLDAGWPGTAREVAGGRAVTLGLDGVGGRIGRSALELLGVAGRLVMFGSASGALTELSASDIFARGISVAAAVGARIMGRPGGLRALETRSLVAAAEGVVTPVIGQRFDLARAADAHESIEARRTIGKTVLTP